MRTVRAFLLLLNGCWILVVGLSVFNLVIETSSNVQTAPTSSWSPFLFLLVTCILTLAVGVRAGYVLMHRGDEVADKPTPGEPSPLRHWGPFRILRPRGERSAPEVRK